jgi:hypothetical protein
VFRGAARAAAGAAVVSRAANAGEAWEDTDHLIEQIRPYYTGPPIADRIGVTLPFRPAPALHLITEITGNDGWYRAPRRAEPRPTHHPRGSLRLQTAGSRTRDYAGFGASGDDPGAFVRRHTLSFSRPR